LLNKADPIDAIFFGSNNLAIEGMAYIQSLKIKVPEELAIVCFDESNAYNLFYCPLTYVKQPLLQIGQKAVEMLLASIESSDTPQHVILDADLIVNASSLPKVS